VVGAVKAERRDARVAQKGGGGDGGGKGTGRVYKDHEDRQTKSKGGLESSRDSDYSFIHLSEFFLD
jgi:hypothetical protein